MCNLAQKEKPGLRVLVNLSKLMPKYFFNAYGAAESSAHVKDRAMVRDVTIALIEANGDIYNPERKSHPNHGGSDQKTSGRGHFRLWLTWQKIASESVNTGFSKERTEWSV